MEDSDWDHQWGNHSSGGGGSPYRNMSGELITDLLQVNAGANNLITRPNISPADQSRLQAKRDKQRLVLQAQIEEKKKRHAQKKREDSLWEKKYAPTYRTAIEQREYELSLQQPRRTPDQPGQAFGQPGPGKQYPLESPRNKPPPDVVTLRPLHGSVVSTKDTTAAAATTTGATAEDIRNARDVQHALANPNDNIQFMTSEAKAAVDEIKREQYLRDLSVQIQQQKERKQRKLQEELEEDLRREQEADGYQPWGRQGGGAPLRDTGGRIITNLRRKNNYLMKNHGDGANLGRGTRKQHMDHHMQVPAVVLPPPPSSPHPSTQNNGTLVSRQQSTHAQGAAMDRSELPVQQRSPPTASKLVESQRSELLRLRAANKNLVDENINLRDELYGSQSSNERLEMQILALEKIVKNYKHKYGGRGGAGRGSGGTSSKEEAGTGQQPRRSSRNSGRTSPRDNPTSYIHLSERQRRKLQAQ